MEDYQYKNLRKDWHLIHPVNRFLTRLDHFVEKALNSFFSLKKHWKTAAVLIIGMIVYDMISRTFYMLFNMFQNNSGFSSNGNNLILFIDICLFFALLFLITMPKTSEPRNRHWYE